MGAKGGGTQGYRYYMSMLMGLCRGPIDELVEIKVGDKTAWEGHKCGNAADFINAPELFGGDDKEGGIQGPFNVFMGDANQVLPGAQVAGGKTLPSVRDSIGGLVSQMRGTTMLWYDGMVSAMSPYLKEWKVRVRRARKGWYGGVAWYPSKSTIYLGGSSLTISTNRPIDFSIIDDTITFSRNVQDGDQITINGHTINYVDDSDPADFEIRPNRNRARSMRTLANYISSKSTTFDATASYTEDSVTLTFVKSNGSTIYAMNAAHIVYECFTDPLWGRGFDPVDIDENSFIYAANKLCTEQFGLCLAWYRKDDIDVFVSKVCDLVGGLTYTDRETGKTVFKLIRDDYVIGDLPLYTPETGLLSIDADDSESSDGSFNEIIGTSVDPVTNLEFQRRVHNLAAYQSQKAPSSLDQDYKGIPTRELMDRVLLRDLRAMSSGLKKYTLTFDRRAWRIAPGSVIRVSHPARGISNLGLRIGEIDDGTMVNGTIKIKAAIDVFGLPATSYQGEADNGWIAPSLKAVPAPEERLVEASYRDIYRELGEAEAQAAEPTSAYIGQLARAPNSTSLDYDLTTKAAGQEYSVKARGPFTGSALLVDDVLPLQTEIELAQVSEITVDNIGEALLIGDEIVVLDAYDETTRMATVRRGAGDTIPQPHEADDVAWTIDDDLITDGVTYTEGETVFTRVLTRTSSDLLDFEEAEEQEIELVGRHARPYPPADVQQAGVSIFLARDEDPEPVFTWVERNRITQADALLGHEEAGTTAEVGTTYTIRIYTPDGLTLLRETTGIAGLTWTYTTAMQTADNPSGTILVELVSVRDGLESYQPYSFPVVLEGGWGYGWGYSWGG